MTRHIVNLLKLVQPRDFNQGYPHNIWREETDMDFELTPDQQRIQSLARQFAEQEVAPLARATNAQDTLPQHLIQRMGELGFLAGQVDKRYGGSGMDTISYVLLSEELGRVASSVRSFLTVQASQVSLSIQEWGSKEQKRFYLPKLASGEYIGCYALTELEVGSDVANIEATATRDGASYLLQGEKIWITNGLSAQIAIVIARRDHGTRHKGISAFLVRTDTPGFHSTPMPEELGHRATEHAHITLDQCRVPKSALLGGPGGGFKIAMTALENGRLTVAAGAVGIGQACLDACIAFARQRHRSGQRLLDSEMIQATIANMTADIAAARLLTYYAAWHKDRGEPATRAIYIAKLFATEAAIDAASKTILLHGNRSASNQYPIERYYRDIKDLQIYEGSNDIQRLAIARDLIGSNL
jgi:alkylation response protein AidB-like acyl-CoA dehydrogenase